MMKKLFAVMIIVFFGLIIVSSSGQAMDRLLTMPTADLITSRGYIYGELLPDNRYNIEGLYLVNPQLEIGGIAQVKDNDYTNLNYGISVKTLLVEEDSSKPAIAVGVRMEEIYFVLSKHLVYGIRGHLGISNNETAGVFAGFNKVINPVQIGDDSSSVSLPTIILMGEYINNRLNLGLRADMNENLTIDFALVNLKNLKLGLGISF